MDAAGDIRKGVTARVAGLVGCRECGTVHKPEAKTCSLCGQRLVSRDKKSMQKVWAWLLAGLIFYVPANMLPILETDTLGAAAYNTILGGVIEFFSHGDYFVAGVIFLASVVIPVSKFFAITYLALGVHFGWRLSKSRRHTLHEFVEFIGRWSMIDVFVVALLAALIQLGFVLTIFPGLGAVCFALSVAFTMLSAQSFDTRLIWDRLAEDNE